GCSGSASLEFGESRLKMGARDRLAQRGSRLVHVRTVIVVDKGDLRSHATFLGQLESPRLRARQVNVPNRGAGLYDVLAFHHPKQGRQPLIARVVGSEGHCHAHAVLFRTEHSISFPVKVDAGAVLRLDNPTRIECTKMKALWRLCTFAHPGYE